MEHTLLDELQEGPFQGTIRARLSRMWDAINIKTKVIMRLDIIFIDEKGNDILAQVPKPLIDIVKPGLEEQRIYLINAFIVKKSKGNYEPTDNPLTIIFTTQTMIHPAAEDDDMPRYKFRFIKATEVTSKCFDTTILSDAFGRLLEYSTTASHSNGTTRTVRKELQIALPGEEQIQVTIWGDIIDQFNRIIDANVNVPILLIITSVVVKDYRGVKFLSSTASTRIYGNLNIPQILPENNPQPAIAAAVEPPNQYNIPDHEDPPQVTIDELDEEKANMENEGRYYDVIAKVEDVLEDWCYYSCSNCPKKIPPGQPEFWCQQCNQNTINGVPRYRIVLSVKDKTTTAYFVILDHTGRKFFNTTAEQLLHANNGDMLQPPEHVSLLIGKTKKFRIRMTRYNIEQSSSTYTLTKVSDMDQQSIEAYDALPTKASSKDIASTSSCQPQQQAYTTTTSTLMESDQQATHSTTEEAKKRGKALQQAYTATTSHSMESDQEVTHSQTEEAKKKGKAVVDSDNTEKIKCYKRRKTALVITDSE